MALYQVLVPTNHHRKRITVGAARRNLALVSTVVTPYLARQAAIVAFSSYVGQCDDNLKRLLPFINQLKSCGHHVNVTWLTPADMRTRVVQFLKKEHQRKKQALQVKHPLRTRRYDDKLQRKILRYVCVST